VSATRLLGMLYKNVNGAFCDGRLPANAVVEDVRLRPGVLGTWNDADPVSRTPLLRVDVARSRQHEGPISVYAHECAHGLTPELPYAQCHGPAFQREYERLLGLMLNALKRREKSDRGANPRAAGGRRLPSASPAPGREPASFDGEALRPISSPRRGSMRNPSLEYAEGDRPQAREQAEAIRYTIDELEKRKPGSTRNLTSWTTRRCGDGKLVAIPNLERRTAR
jgi:hypothetical protein